MTDNDLKWPIMTVNETVNRKVRVVIDCDCDRSLTAVIINICGVSKITNINHNIK